MTPERITPERFARLKEVFNAESNPVTYLGIDPGRANGVCGYDVDYYLAFAMTVHEADMIEFLELFHYVQKCIYEGYSLYPNKIKEQVYSDMETPRVIGRIEGWAARKKVELIKQNATIKTTGYAWLGQKKPSKSDPKNHEKDANAHFVYWAVKNGKINARRLLKQ